MKVKSFVPLALKQGLTMLISSNETNGFVYVLQNAAR
jgi:hypothetical protein